MVRVTFTNRAIDNLDAIGEYHAHYSPSCASLLQDSIISKADLLRYQPEMGRNVPESDFAHPRGLIQKSYRIVYKIVSPCDRENLTHKSWLIDVMEAQIHGWLLLTQQTTVSYASGYRLLRH